MEKMKKILMLFCLVMHCCKGFRSPKLITFWGQNAAFESTGSNEKSLANLCGDKSPYATVVIGYVSRFYDDRNKDLLPGMGFSYHCNKATDDSHPSLLYCPRIASDIRFCHEHDRKILIGLGGPNSPSSFKNPTEAEKFARTVWNLFLGGDDMSDLRPFGSVVLDGINIYMDNQNSQHMNVFLKTLHDLRQSDLSKKYYITISPSCMFPDPYFGPGNNMILDDTKHIVDQVYIRYINKGCCAVGSYSFRNSLAKWKEYMKMPNGAEFYMAIPASPHATTMESCYRSPRQMEIVYNSLKSRLRFKGFCIMDNSFDLQDRQAGFVFSNNLLYHILPKSITYIPVKVPYVIKVPITQPPIIRSTVTPEPIKSNPPPTKPPATESPITEPPTTEPPVTEDPATEAPATEPPLTKPPIGTTTTTTTTTTPAPTPPPQIPTTQNPGQQKVTTPIQEQKSSADDLMEINGPDTSNQQNENQEEDENDEPKEPPEAENPNSEPMEENVEDEEDQGKDETEEQERAEQQENDNQSTTDELIHPTAKPSPAQAAEIDAEKDDEDQNEDEDEEDGVTPNPEPIHDDKKLKNKHLKHKKKVKNFYKIKKLRRKENEKEQRHSFRHEVDSHNPPGILGGDLYTSNNNEKVSFVINNSSEDDGSSVSEEFILDGDTYKNHNRKDVDNDEFSASGSSDQTDGDLVYFYPSYGNTVQTAFALKTMKKQLNKHGKGIKKQKEMQVPNVSNPYGNDKPPLTHDGQFDENRKYLDMLQEGLQKQTDKFNQDIMNQQPMDQNKVDQTQTYPYPIPDPELEKVQTQQRDLASNMNLNGNMNHLKLLMAEMAKNVNDANKAIEEKQMKDGKEINANEKTKSKSKNQNNFFFESMLDFFKLK